jgi:ribosome-binding protein aMBF1 (putative translation factor)
MIKNEKQYRISKGALARFEESLAHLKERQASGVVNSRIHPRLQHAEMNAVRSEIEVLRGQIEEYEATQAGKRPVADLTVIETIPQALIQARIAAGLSQKDLAARLGLKEQQIQRYEANEYASASLRRVREVIAALTNTTEAATRP